MDTVKRVAFYTLGCRLNFSETGALVKGFRQRGYRVVPFGETADVVFINTCTVTDDADSSCRRLIRKAWRINPEGKIVVAGCYAQMEPQRVAQMQGVDLVLGTAQKHKVFDFLADEEGDKIQIDRATDFCAAATDSAEGHTRAFLKIQDGCNYVCSFCIIPQARGRSRAISIDQAVAQAQRVVADGFREIVLTGVNIGEYYRTSGEKLSHLLEALFRVEGLERLRLSSLEPNTIDDELLETLAASAKFMPHFHIPLQSGDDTILREMKRKYDRSGYEKVLKKIVSYFPGAGIGADVIAGFPGEREAQFQNTYRLLEELPITHFHVFPYSRRKNTPAAKKEEQVLHHVKKDRVQRLRALGEKKLGEFATNQLGNCRSVLFEYKNSQGLWEGYTPQFVRVAVESDLDLKNQIGGVLPLSAEGSLLRGKMVLPQREEGTRAIG